MFPKQYMLVEYPGNGPFVAIMASTGNIHDIIGNRQTGKTELLLECLDGLLSNNGPLVGTVIFQSKLMQFMMGIGSEHYSTIARIKSKLVNHPGLKLQFLGEASFNGECLFVPYADVIAIFTDDIDFHASVKLMDAGQYLRVYPDVLFINTRTNDDNPENVLKPNRDDGLYWRRTNGFEINKDYLRGDSPR